MKIIKQSIPHQRTSASFFYARLSYLFLMLKGKQANYLH
jgi:hypothetical protein